MDSHDRSHIHWRANSVLFDLNEEILSTAINQDESYKEKEWIRLQGQELAKDGKD